MPSSRPHIIPLVIQLLRQLKPESILDVGVGFGKWGHLFREYTDVLAAEHEPARYHRKHWRVRIDGIEGHAAYLTPMHRFLYNRIHVGDAARILPRLPEYDLIFLGDIIEHFAKDAGTALLHEAWQRARQAVIVSTPKFETCQEALCGNELERHRSLWRPKDFLRTPGAWVKTVDGETLLAVLPKPGVPKLDGTTSRRRTGNDARRLVRTRQELVDLIPPDKPFVLVDEEQLRPTLPHRRALPFMEKAGQYWGPPGDDAAAVAELERLRRRGAKWLVFVWSTYWWLEHYAQFARHLRNKYACVRRNEFITVFSLSSKGRSTD
jgi:hypothetical protein